MTAGCSSPPAPPAPLDAACPHPVVDAGVLLHLEVITQEQADASLKDENTVVPCYLTTVVKQDWALTAVEQAAAPYSVLANRYGDLVNLRFMELCGGQPKPPPRGDDNQPPPAIPPQRSMLHLSLLDLVPRGSLTIEQYAEVRCWVRREVMPQLSDERWDVVAGWLQAVQPEGWGEYWVQMDTSWDPTQQHPGVVTAPLFESAPHLAHVWLRLAAWAMHDTVGVERMQCRDPLYVVDRHLAMPEVVGWKQAGRAPNTRQSPPWVLRLHEAHAGRLERLDCQRLPGSPSTWWDSLVKHMCNVYRGNWNWMCRQGLRLRVETYWKVRLSPGWCCP